MHLNFPIIKSCKNDQQHLAERGKCFKLYRKVNTLAKPQRETQKSFNIKLKKKTLGTHLSFNL